VRRRLRLRAGKKPPFADGNKRAAFLAVGVFLRIKGYRPTVGQICAGNAVISLAAGDLPETGFSAWLRAGCMALK